MNAISECANACAQDAFGGFHWMESTARPARTFVAISERNLPGHDELDDGDFN